MNQRFPGRKFSVLRLAIATTVTAVLAASGIFAWNYTANNQFTPQRWFGGYVDVTATPQYAFEANNTQAYKNTVLSFIVSHEGACEPSWGGYYTLPEAGDALDLDRKIQRMMRSGQEIVVSFGGLINDTLATTCTTPSDLADAYTKVLNHYDITVVDFDIEADDIGNKETREKRVAATLEVQDNLKEQGKTLGVWLTLPADRNGLTGQGLAVVNEFLSAGVSVSGVNLMVMNFGVPSTTTSQGKLSIDALNAAHAQLRNQFWLRGELYSDEQIWRRLGATPMIGQNDHADETFTLEDARDLHQFAETVKLGRTSFWSLNRDRECEANYPNLTVVSDFCSGVAQASGEFATLMAAGVNGNASDAATSSDNENPAAEEVTVDDPETSPYPVWSEGAAYPAETRVVWHGNVYISSWWSRGDQPDMPIEGGQSPWRLIGPVLPGETPRKTVTLPVDFYPAWNPETIYEQGTRVLHKDGAYEAKWWSQGDSPEAAAEDPAGSPWDRLTETEINELLAK